MTQTPTREQILAAYDAEEATLSALLARISDAQWSGPTREDGWNIHEIVGHIGDSANGLAGAVRMSPEQFVGFDIHTFNVQRRELNRSRTRAELEAQIASGFAAARAALTPDLDLDAPTPIPGRTAGQILYGIALHAGDHRREIEALLD